MIDRPSLCDPNIWNLLIFKARNKKGSSPGWSTSWRDYYWQLWNYLSNCFHKHSIVDCQHYWSALLREIAVKPPDYNHSGKGELLINVLKHKFLEPEDCCDCADRPPGEHVLGVVIGQRYSGLTTNRSAWDIKRFLTCFRFLRITHLSSLLTACQVEVKKNGEGSQLLGKRWNISRKPDQVVLSFERQDNFSQHFCQSKSHLFLGVKLEVCSVIRSTPDISRSPTTWRKPVENASAIQPPVPPAWCWHCPCSEAPNLCSPILAHQSQEWRLR